MTCHHTSVTLLRLSPLTPSPLPTGSKALMSSDWFKCGRQKVSPITSPFCTVLARLGVHMCSVTNTVAQVINLHPGTCVSCSFHTDRNNDTSRQHGRVYHNRYFLHPCCASLQCFVLHLICYRCSVQVVLKFYLLLKHSDLPFKQGVSNYWSSCFKKQIGTVLSWG